MGDVCDVSNSDCNLNSPPPQISFPYYALEGSYGPSKFSRTIDMFFTCYADNVLEQNIAVALQRDKLVLFLSPLLTLFPRNQIKVIFYYSTVEPAHAAIFYGSRSS